jgi:hypothetical protein
MIKIMATYAQGLEPIPVGENRGIIQRQDVLDAISQLAALVDESYYAGLISREQGKLWNADADGYPRTCVATSGRRARRNATAGGLVGSGDRHTASTTLAYAASRTRTTRVVQRSSLVKKVLQQASGITLELVGPTTPPQWPFA